MRDTAGIGFERDADDLPVVRRRHLERGNWPSARRIDAASSTHLSPCANAGGAAASARRMTGSARDQDIRFMRQPAAARRLPSIWPMASTTASKVSRVEAWRAL